VERFMRWYGAGPLHLLSLIAAFALAGYAGVRLLSADLIGVLTWLVGAAVVHDLLLFPLYAIADRSMQAVLRHRAGTDDRGVPWLNYVRVPALLSGLLLLVWFPLILRLPAGYPALTTLTTDPYLERWLLVTGVFFAGSALVFAWSLRRHRRARSAR